MSAKIEMPDVQDWINKYQSGMSLKQMAEQTGISRNAIRRQFMEQGVLIRGRSEAERVKWQAIKQAPDRVARQCAAAWQAARGRDDDLEGRVLQLYRENKLGAGMIAQVMGCSRRNVQRILRNNSIKGDQVGIRRAYGRQMAKTNIVSPFEERLWLACQSLGLHLNRQTAIDGINVDFTTAEGIVIELERRSLAESKSLTHERLEHLFSRGHRLIVVHLPRGTTPMRDFNWLPIAQQIIATLEHIRAHPATPGQYRMISSKTQRLAAHRAHFNGYTEILPSDGSL